MDYWSLMCFSYNHSVFYCQIECCQCIGSLLFSLQFLLCVNIYKHILTISMVLYCNKVWSNHLHSWFAICCNIYDLLIYLITAQIWIKKNSCICALITTHIIKRTISRISFKLYVTFIHIFIIDLNKTQSFYIFR